MKAEIRNAKIESTYLGTEDHGIFTFLLRLDYGGSGQGFGNYCLGIGFTDTVLRRILKVVGVESWEELPGSYIRAKQTHNKVEAIGNALKDDWLDIEELSKSFDKEE